MHVSHLKTATLNLQLNKYSALVNFLFLNKPLDCETDFIINTLCNFVHSLMPL